MTESEQPDEATVARLVLMNGYGEVMLRFQVLEMSYWQILATRIKRGSTLDQGIARLSGWAGQTGERLINKLGLPDDLRAEADAAVKTRNYLAHDFLRDQWPFLSEPPVCRSAAEQLAAIAVHIEEFEGRLNLYVQDLGVQELTEEEIEELGLVAPADFTAWTTRPGG
jgi:hypothetical protein